MSIHKIDYISSQTQSEEFTNFLKGDNNAKLIFSAKFGSGKTTFLKNFFQNNEQYIPIFIYPVNYSIVSNEDIFELIKYNILLQLLSIGDISKYLVGIQSSSSTELLLVEHPENIISPLLKAIPNIGVSVKDMLDGVLLLKESLEESSSEQKEQVSKIAKLIERDNENIFESNIISTLISSIINEFKKQNPEKELILVVDDLDRIDPAHIFRIMNVFAAHNDIEDDSKNKFGLHKIITVCDVNNIKSIFHHFYGDDTDFNGYLGKFHNKSIFNFDIKKDISENIDSVLERIKVTENKSQYKLTEIRYYNIIKPILVEMIYLEIVNIKSILKLKKEISIAHKYIVYKDKPYNLDYDLFFVYKMLLTIFSDHNNLINNVRICSNLNSEYTIAGSNSYLEVAISYIVDLLKNNEKDKTVDEPSKLGLRLYENINTDYIFIYRESNRIRNGYPVDIFGIISKNTYDKSKDKSEVIRILEPFPFWELILDSFKLIYKVLEQGE